MTTNGPNIAIACQGGGSHAAFCAGALNTLLPKIEADGATLVGISGTSGGAICALLAWYGWLKGGAAEAKRMLDAFWASNSATSIAEILWNNAAVDWARALPFEVQFSPNRWPFDWNAFLLTGVWPWTTDTFGTTPSSIRGNFFQLGKLIGDGVDFTLIEALGNVCSIPADVARWIEIDYQEAMCKATAAQSSADAKRRLETNISHAFATAGNMAWRMDAAKFGPRAPLRHAFSWAAAPPPAFERASLQAFRATVVEAMAVVPQLLLGAVDIADGSFAAFSSEKSTLDGGISLKAVLASAALPWLFDAVKIDRANADGLAVSHSYWDGLFSQNPPLKNFISDPVADERKPDQIWLLQINPDRFDTGQLNQGIADRRNELAGNLSMNQEIAFIKAINKRLEALQAGDAALKHMQVDRILLERDVIERITGRPMDATSKFDRSADLARALINHGDWQAQRFLAMKPAIAEACRQLDEADALTHVLSPAAAACLACLRAAKLELVIDETVSPPSTERERPDVLVRWHAHGTIAGARARIEGEAAFSRVGNGQVPAVKLTNISIDGIAMLGTGAGIQPQLDAPRAGVPTAAAAQANHAAAPTQANHAGPH